MNAMNLETYQDHCLKLDELASGDVEITIAKKGVRLDTFDNEFPGGWVDIVKVTIPRYRISLIIEFLSKLQ